MQPWSPPAYKPFLILQWGSHLAHFFGSGDELRDVLVPYFKAGLENNERCLWVTGKAFDAEQARSACARQFPISTSASAISRSKSQMVTNGTQRARSFGPTTSLADSCSASRMRSDWATRVFRTNGNCAWVSQDQWVDFLEYETLVQKSVRGRRMICMCSYCVDQVQNGSHLEVMERHDLAVPSALRSHAAAEPAWPLGSMRTPSNPDRRAPIAPVSGTPETDIRSCDDRLGHGDLALYAGRQYLRL